MPETKFFRVARMGHHTYPLPRLDQKVLSRLDEYDDVIRWDHFQPFLAPLLTQSTTVYL